MITVPYCDIKTKRLRRLTLTKYRWMKLNRIRLPVQSNAENLTCRVTNTTTTLWGLYPWVMSVQHTPKHMKQQHTVLMHTQNDGIFARGVLDFTTDCLSANERRDGWSEEVGAKKGRNPVWTNQQPPVYYLSPQWCSFWKTHFLVGRFFLSPGKTISNTLSSSLITLGKRRAEELRASVVETPTTQSDTALTY